MNVEGMYNSLLNGVSGVEDATSINPAAGSGTETTTSFDNLLSSSLESLNNQQVAANEATTGMVTGEIDNLHNVMIQTTEAQLSLELAIQVRNKAIEAYNDIKNMQF